MTKMAQKNTTDDVLSQSQIADILYLPNTQPFVEPCRNSQESLNNSKTIHLKVYQHTNSDFCSCSLTKSAPSQQRLTLYDRGSRGRYPST